VTSVIDRNVVSAFVFGSAGMHARTTKKPYLFAHGWGVRDVVEDPSRFL
jgi:hypothetical protein